MISVDPAVITTKGATLKVRAKYLFDAVTIDLNSTKAPVIDDAWKVSIGEELLPQTAVKRINTEELSVEIPSSLRPGVKDVTITSPGGVSATLKGCLTILDAAETSLTIESAPGGMGHKIGDIELLSGQTMGLYAVARKASQVVVVEDVRWEIEGTAGKLSGTSGSSVIFTADLLGTSTVTAAHERFGSDRTGTISIAGCAKDSDCPKDSCRSRVQCLHGACVAGDADKDDDGDGFVDANCPGGTDCDDNNANSWDSCSTCVDQDKDGYYKLCDSYTGIKGPDCDDASSTTYPGAAPKDSATACMKDADGDDYGDKSPKWGVVAGSDCADTPGTDPACNGTDGAQCNPGFAGFDGCDGADNDCDGSTDENPNIAWYADADGDGFGDAGKLQMACAKPNGYVTDRTDCDDNPALCGNLCFPAASEATSSSSCTDGFDNDCDGKVDRADAECNLPPKAAFTVTPIAGDTNTVFHVDASASSDLEDTANMLQVRWDWESDRIWDTSFTTDRNASHTYTADGMFSITLEVRDTAGASDFITHVAAVTTLVNLITVNTAVDENASPGTGTSLREAIVLSNATAGKQTIVFSGPMTINLSASLGQLPSLSSDVDILANRTVVVDGSNLSTLSDCLRISNGAVTVTGLEIRNCPYCGIDILSGNSPKATIRDCYIHDNAWVGILVDSQSGQVIGPGDELAFNTMAGVSVYGDASDSFVIRGNNVHDNTEAGIALYGLTNGPDNGLIELNLISRNGRSGIYLLQNSTNNIIRHNTSVYNGTNGVSFVNSTCNGNEVRNNVFVGNTDYGIDPAGSAFTALDYNLFFSNGSGDCNGCAAQPNSVYQGPWFVNADGNDFRLGPNSPAIDRGADLGVDVNGPGPGNYNGTAPDIGALESP
jgi:hypothetical protein